MAKKKVREKNRKSQLAEIEIREGWVKHMAFPTEIFGCEGALTASVVVPFTAFQFAGNIDCGKEKVAHFICTSTEE